MNNIPTSPNDPVNTDILLVRKTASKGSAACPSTPFPNNADILFR